MEWLEKVYLVATVLDLNTREALALFIPEGHNEGMHTMVVKSAAAIRCRHLEPCKHGPHLAILGCIANPPAVLWCGVLSKKVSYGLCLNIASVAICSSRLNWMQCYGIGVLSRC